jgi:hypothetical protein
MFCCTCKWISVIYTVTSTSPLCFTFSIWRWWNEIVELVIKWIIFPCIHTFTYPWNQDGLFVTHIMQDKVWCLFVGTTQKAQTVVEAQLYTFLTLALHGGYVVSFRPYQLLYRRYPINSSSESPPPHQSGYFVEQTNFVPQPGIKPQFVMS